MMLVLILLAALWGLGALFGVARHKRAGLLAGIWLASGLALWLLPDTQGLSRLLGGSLKAWASLSLAGLLLLAYAWVLGRLKARAPVSAALPVSAPVSAPVSLPVPAAPAAAPPPASPARKPGFSPEELDRYARHILLREIGGPGQRALKSAKVLVIGAGGLGSPALLYLAAAGVGEIGVMDDDHVDASNLQRQIIHRMDSLGRLKVESAREAMQALNPHVLARSYPRRFDASAAEVLAGHDLILDGSDNFDTRYLVNRLAVAAAKPLISAAITQWEGQISLYDPARGGPCYECVFADRPAPGMVPTCAEVGVAAPLPGVVGAMMAMEAVKQLTGAGQTLRGRLMIHDALYAETRVIELQRRADCPVCGHLHGL